MGRKRDLSIFSAIEDLDTQDRKAARKRKKETTAEKKRAREVQSQTKLYNHLLESRILLQRAIHKVNTKRIDGDRTAFRESCNGLIQRLLEARNQLSEKSTVDYERLLLASSRTKLHTSLQEEYEEQRDEWKSILNRKHKNLRLHAGVTAKSQFRIMDSSFWEQVEATMEYESIRNSTEEEAVIFDDSKVYQQLLKDFVTANSNANATTAASSMERKQQSNPKKDVDRRASKGRKIRYKEIPKLVNFTFPLSRPNTSTLNTEEYFQSLFGGAASKRT